MMQPGIELSICDSALDLNHEVFLSPKTACEVMWRSEAEYFQQ